MSCPPVTIIFVETAPVVFNFDEEPVVDVTFAGTAIPGPPGPASAYVFPPPVSSSSPGIRGEWSYAEGYIYWCVDTDSWLRFAGTPF